MLLIPLQIIGLTSLPSRHKDTGSSNMNTINMQLIPIQFSPLIIADDIGKRNAAVGVAVCPWGQALSSCHL